MCGRFRQMAGALLVLSGVLIVFLCLPMEFFLIALGVALAGSRAAASAVKGRKKRDGRENGLHQATEISARAASPADGQSGLTTRKLCRINR